MGRLEIYIVSSRVSAPPWNIDLAPFYLGPPKKIINLSEPPAPSLLPPVMSNPIKILENLIPPLQGFPQVLCSEHGGGGLRQYMGGAKGGLKCCQKYLWRSSFDSKVAGFKPAGLQIY